jgi:RNA polymerase sigma-70 factor (ECF subfamily)
MGKGRPDPNKGGVSMEDDEIVELFWQRSETAISEAERKYSKYCHSIAFGILRCREDAEECVNGTLARAWSAIPPTRPSVLRTFLGKITRNLSLNALQKMNAAKRGMGQMPLALSELEECIPDTGCLDVRSVKEESITKTINGFLGRCDASERKVFVRRYWYASSIKEIAADYGMSVNKVKSMLFRLRKRLRTELEKEGITL